MLHFLAKVFKTQNPENVLNIVGMSGAKSIKESVDYVLTRGITGGAWPPIAKPKKLTTKDTKIHEGSLDGTPRR
jgi:hypothetical protein